VTQPTKKGPRRKRRRTYYIHASWQHCERCCTHATTYPNRQMALRAITRYGGDPNSLCTNQYGGIHIAS
jgi:hypothetical protein